MCCNKMVGDKRKWNLNFSCLVKLLLLAASAQCASSRFFDILPQSGPVIIDTDAGVYDAMAILMLLRHEPISVKAITCVRGNTDAITVAMNVQKTLNVLNRYDVPIYVGANYGLVHTEKLKPLFGKDGFCDIDSNKDLLMTNLKKGHAAVAMAKLVSENPGKITVLCLGPLTNLAIACHLQPQFLKLAKSVLILGGTLAGIGTFTPGVEFNFQMDPEAAAFVLNRAEVSDAPVVIFPLETMTNQRINKKWQIEYLEKLGTTTAAKFIVRLLQELDTIPGEKLRQVTFAAYDVYLAACLMSPMYASRMKQHYVTVETHGQVARGLMLVDFANSTGRRINVRLVVEADSEELKLLLLNSFA